MLGTLSNEKMLKEAWSAEQGPEQGGPNGRYYDFQHRGKAVSVLRGLKELEHQFLELSQSKDQQLEMTKMRITCYKEFQEAFAKLDFQGKMAFRSIF